MVFNRVRSVLLGILVTWNSVYGSLLCSRGPLERASFTALLTGLDSQGKTGTRDN